MNNRVKLIIWTVIFMALIVCADKFLKLQSYDSSLNNSGEDNLAIFSGEEVENKSKVLEVTLETFSGEVLESGQKVLIDFYATWCEPCKMLSPIVEEIANENENIKVVKIDVDKEFELASKYYVMSLPTLVVFENGIEKDRMVGYQNKEYIEDMIH